MWATLINWLNPRRGSLELSICSWLVRSTGNYLGLWLASEVCVRRGGQSYGTEPLTCRIWLYLCADSVRIQLNCRTPSWFHKELLGVGEIPWEDGFFFPYTVTQARGWSAFPAEGMAYANVLSWEEVQHTLEMCSKFTFSGRWSRGIFFPFSSWKSPHHTHTHTHTHTHIMRIRNRNSIF